MKPTNEFVIFREGRDEFLASCQRKTDVNLLGWGQSPASALKYDSLKRAQSEAQRIATNNECCLVVCELHESDSQIALEEVARVSPITDPSRN